MKKKGFYSLDFVIIATGLLLSVLVVNFVYELYIRPLAQDIEITSRLQSTQNPDKSFATNRSLAIIVKDYEQQVCISLMMWASVIIGYKFIKIRRESSMLSKPFLRMSRGERILPEDALSHYKEVEGKVSGVSGLADRILPDIIMSALHRFDSTRSIQDAAHAVKERAELAYEKLESDLSLVRYIAWAIPSVGFIGTVRGIGEALAQADQAIRGDIEGVTSSLGLAFNSTLIALFLSIILMFFVHLLQSKQETLLIELEDFVSRNIVGLMKTPNKEEETSSVSFS
ncbi:MotA/TolQ/ExbB proton channel family protein [Puniceicoccaceae bacterium K14]|nr:MotA/TolQ/ExbB proton channel family protein [Puniceicoccaceae bacterium K14]